MKKLLKLFIIGLAITLGSFAILYSGVINSDAIIMIVFPMGIGISLVMLSVSIGIRKWVRGLEKD